jgi:GntR family transcriptional regulator
LANLDAIDRTKPQKLYCQLASVLRSQVEAGQWEVGSQIPTEDHLCRLYNVSKATVRLAVDELVSLGYLKKFQGKGTFVRRRKPEHSIPLLTNFAEDGTCRNPSCTTRLVDYGLVKPPEHVRSQLSSGEGDDCHYLSALTIAYDSPHSLRKAYVPRGLLPSSLDEGEAERATRGHLYVFIESRCGQKIHRVQETIDIARAEAADAAHLGLEPGSPIVRAIDLCTASGGVPIIFCESLYRTDAYARTVEFERLTM